MTKFDQQFRREARLRRDGIWFLCFACALGLVTYLLMRWIDAQAPQAWIVGTFAGGRL